MIRRINRANAAVTALAEKLYKSELSKHPTYSLLYNTDKYIFYQLSSASYVNWCFIIQTQFVFPYSTSK
jgi:hypothetical protein